STPRFRGVVTSYKKVGSTKLTNGKKGTHLRKITHFSADSGHSTNSDSASQTEAVQGLDRCASLLQDILRNEDSGSEIVYSENRSNPRPLEGKRYGYKKKGFEKHTFPLGAQKEMTSSRNKKKIPNETSAGSGKDISDLPQNWSLQDHYRMYSPMIYQALHDHVQTQMSLMKNFASKKNTSGISLVPGHSGSGSGSESQAASDSNYGSYTSRSVWSPQQPSCPQVVHSEVQTDDDNQFSSQTKTVPVNSADCLRNSFNTIPGVPCSLPQTDTSAIPTFQPLGLGTRILPQQGVPKEADLLKCFQTYMSLFQSHGKETHSKGQMHRSPIPSLPPVWATNEEKRAKGQIREATSEGKDLNIGVRDANIIKDVQKAKNVNQTAEKVRTLKYLLRELKALVAEQEDSEVHRLVTEVEACVSVLPAVNGITDIQFEIALAMQPLRRENAQLRR
uniref:Coiled-coil domain containing 14 n=1 Tax=Otolemur garnettii TaxID=30611 RepID=H0XXI4_OTOGA